MTGVTFYTYGGGEVLWRLLNAIALIVADGSVTTLTNIILGVSGGWFGFQSLKRSDPILLLKTFVLPSLAVVAFLYGQKVSVTIIDPIDPKQHLAKVDNVPFAVGYLGSLTSSVMLSLSEVIEEKAAPLQGDGLKYTKTGPMFAAHLIGRARDSRIVDPVARQNVKTFVYQCFTWPFVITNLSPGSHAAQTAKDILAFVAGAPHPGLGVYWRFKTGVSQFKTCQACVPLVRKLMGVHKKQGVLSLLKGVFTTTPLTQSNSVLLQSYAHQGWSQLTNASQGVFDMVGQQMLINAYREGLDDQRESFGLSRLDPRLVSYQATRAMATQNAGFLINGALIARNLPILQNVLLGVILFLFLLVVPLSMMPGGLRILGTWIKLLVWCQSWPVFYTLLNCVGLMWLKASLGTTGVDVGGVTILTQNGLAEAAYDAYCIVQNLSMAVPFLSWAVLSGSGHAVVSLSERMMSANGASAAASMVDNSYTLDSTQLHSRSLATQQIAQQTLGASFSTGHIVDDGQFRALTSSSGNVAVHETTSTLGTTLTHSDALQNSFSDAIARSEQATLSHQKAFSKASSAALSNVATLADQWGHGHAVSEDFSQSENLGVQKSLNKIQDYVEKYGLTQSANTTTSSSLDASMRVGTPKSLAGLIGFEAGVSGKTGTAALNQDGLELAKNAGLTDQETENINTALSHAMTNRVSTSSDTALRASTDLRGNLDEMQTASHNLSASYAKTNSLNETATFLQSSGATLSRNMMDDVLDATARQHFGGDKVQAARYQKTHPEAFRKEVQAYEQGFTDHLLTQVMTGKGPSTSDGILSHYKDYASKVSGTVQDRRGDVSVAQNTQGLSGIKQQVAQGFESGQGTFETAQAETAHTLRDHGEEIKGAHEGLQGRVEGNLRSSTLIRTGKEVGRNVGEISDADKEYRKKRLEELLSKRS